MSQGNSPAFPCQDQKKNIYTGMNLRDYFALEAMNGILQATPYNAIVDPTKLAGQSYLIADAMLDERAKHP